MEQINLEPIITLHSSLSNQCNSVVTLLKHIRCYHSDLGHNRWKLHGLLNAISDNMTVVCGAFDTLLCGSIPAYRDEMYETATGLEITKVYYSSTQLKQYADVSAMFADLTAWLLGLITHWHQHKAAIIQHATLISDQQEFADTIDKHFAHIQKLLDSYPDTDD